MSNKQGKKRRNVAKRRKGRGQKRVLDRIARMYIPEIVKVGPISGVSGASIPAGGTGPIIQRAFLTSLDELFPPIANNILGHFMRQRVEDTMNTILIRLKNKTEAHIYKNVPLALDIRSRVNMSKGTLVTDEHIADITGVAFEDAVINLNPEDGEQFVWLFRSKWLFGLYFDLTGKLKQSELLPYLGTCWKRVNYLGEYQFMASEDQFEEMVSDGWFPFIALRGKKFRALMMYYKEGCKYHSQVDSVVDSFDDATIDGMIQYWWANEHFAAKKQMITDAINAYKSGTYTLAGKALSTELEGILRYAYDLEIASVDPNATQKPNTFDLREYLRRKTQEKYSHADSLCFPVQFIQYLEKYTFRGFDLSVGSVPEGRNPVAHGVTPDEMYTKEFALKAILALDNAYFFLGKTATDMGESSISDDASPN